MNKQQIQRVLMVFEGTALDFVHLSTTEIKTVQKVVGDADYQTFLSESISAVLLTQTSSFNKQT